MADVDVDQRDSILISIKKLLGIEDSYDIFDDELIMNINSVLMTLNQIGFKRFSIEGKNDTWNAYLEDRDDLQAVKSYIYLKVRLLFDPPQMGYLIDSIRKQSEELEWRLNMQVEMMEEKI